jgi:uncharacterized protein (DUF1697 family)
MQVTPMNYAAFFRNLNLGRPNCPTRLQLERAFKVAGAQSAASFLTNGTVVFEVGAGRRARQVLAAARRELRACCGLVEPVFIRRVSDLAELVAQDPFAAVDPDSVYERCVSFLHPEVLLPAAVPAASRRGDVEVLCLTATEALCVSRKVGNTPGSPNAFLERLLGLPATTRSWNTVRRLVGKHG